MTNSLQAALNKQAHKTEENTPKKETKKAAPQKQTKKKKKDETVLIGGHFSKELAKQLKLIAAEEGVTNKELLLEALNLLFVKKGKAKIQDI